MSVMLETSLGDIIIDLLVDEAPKTCTNFLKLCKIKYYNYAPIYNVQRDYSFQTGDPIGPGSKDSDGGSCIWGLLPGPGSKSFAPEIGKKLKHSKRGTVSMATAPSRDNSEELVAGSQFIVTLREDVRELDGKAAIFGYVVEGEYILNKINAAFVDEDGRPLKDIRLRHTHVLEDPFPDPPGLVIPDQSPQPTPAQLATVRIADDESIDGGADQESLQRERRRREAEAQALTLEMVGDLPFAEVKPPENVLFVCKLNPVTQDEDLETIFSPYGKILSCEIIRDRQTGDSLQYAFIEYENQADCEKAYFKMQDALIDDHRIHVDFSQSVSRLSSDWRDQENAKRKQWGGFGGIRHLERRTQYREEEQHADGKSGRYGYVFSKNGNRTRDDTRGSGDASRRRARSRSPRWDRDGFEDRRVGYHDSDSDRRRQRSRDRYGGDRRRDRSRDRHRADERDHRRRRH